jgi:hypothetical protein
MMTTDKTPSKKSSGVKTAGPAAGDRPDAPDQSCLWCWIAIVAVLIAAAVIRGRLLAIPFERDEGEYAYIAQQMLKGVPPYESAYSMKLPGIYAVYAVILAVFGQTHTAVHLGLLIVNAATIFIIFLLAKNMFGPLAGVASGCAYAILSLTAQVNGLMANAEHFVVLPALAGLLLIYKTGNERRYIRLLAAGLLLGLAFIIKQHGVFFAVFGAIYLLYCDLHHRRVQLKKAVVAQLVLAAGIVIPFGLTCLILWKAGVFDKFWFWAFTYAREYATAISLSNARMLFKEQFGYIIAESPFIWFFVLLGLFALIIVRHYRRWGAFVLGLLLFSFLAVCPGFYFRGHYFIFLLPAVAVLAGAGFAAIGRVLLFLKKLNVLDRMIITGAIWLAIAGFSLYQQRIYLFDNPPDIVCRMIYGANPFPESLRVAEFIRDNSRPDDTVAVIGSEPQIYFYSGRRAATHYIYMYPLMEGHNYAAEMQKEMIGEIESAKPEFIVLVNVYTSWLAGSGSVQDIFTWFNSYVDNSYNLVGTIDIPASGQTVYRWNDQAIGRNPVSENWVVVFKKRQ